MTDDDKELLIMAAKAAGKKLWWPLAGGSPPFIDDSFIIWDPLNVLAERDQHIATEQLYPDEYVAAIGKAMP